MAKRKSIPDLSHTVASSHRKGGGRMASKKKASPAQIAQRERFARMARERAAGGGGGHLGASGGRGGRELPVNKEGVVYLPGGKKWEVSVGTTQEVHLDNYPLFQIALALLDEGTKPDVADFSAFQPELLDELQSNQARLNASNGVQPEGVSDAAWKLYRDFGQERFLGANLFHVLGVALLYRQMTAAQWASLYTRAVMEGRQKIGGGGFVPAASGGGWGSPLGAPTQVTSPFGAMRDGKRHEGVDLRAAVGTPVLAPVNSVVISVGEDANSGKYVQLAAQLPDGSYPGTFLGIGTPGKDDSTWINTFAHLSEVQVKEGDTVSQGQQVALSGATGNVTGPHLHWKLEWFADDTFSLNERIYVNPLALVPIAVLEQGPGAMGPVVSAQVPAIFEPRGGALGAVLGQGQRTGTVVVANNSLVSIAGGNSNAGVGVGNSLDLGLVNPDIGGAVGGAVGQLPAPGGVGSALPVLPGSF